MTEKQILNTARERSRLQELTDEEAELWLKDRKISIEVGFSEMQACWMADRYIRLKRLLQCQ